jgi:hypothetical protein
MQIEITKAGLEGVGVPPQLAQRVAEIIQREHETGVLNRTPEEKNTVSLAFKFHVMAENKQIVVD